MLLGNIYGKSAKQVAHSAVYFAADEVVFSKLEWIIRKYMDVLMQ